MPCGAAETSRGRPPGHDDRGPVHMHMVADSALRLLRLLVTGGLTPDVVKDRG